jgi:hypothetical protein
MKYLRIIILVKEQNLSSMYLSGGNLMWCGSFDIITDENIAAQFAYHFCRIKCESSEFIEARNSILKFANEFHFIGKNNIDKLKPISLKE